jgi:hypothetical protein
LFLTRSVNGDKEIVKMDCNIVDCEFTNSSVEILLPQTVSSSMTLCENPHGLCLCADPVTVWANSKCDADYYKALSLYLYQRIHVSGLSISQKKNLHWAFEPNFMKTAKALGFFQEERKIKMLLRACAETILGDTTRDVHQLRRGKGGNDPQKKQESDGANRRDIDYEYHMHYWKTTKGPVFMSVVVHNDMKITQKAEDVPFTSLMKNLPHLSEEQED